MTRPGNIEPAASSAHATSAEPESQTKPQDNNTLPVPKKKSKPRINDEDITQDLIRWDVFLAGLMMILLVVIASAPVRNSELWLHLATGKQVLQGSNGIWSDPFTYAGNEGPFGNPTWMFDALAYVLYSGLGETALVALGVLLIAAFVAVGIQASQAKNRLLVNLSCAALAGAVLLWLYYDLRDVWMASNLGSYVWVVLSKLAALFVFLVIAAKIGNWTNSNRRMFAVGAVVLGIGMCVWLGYDLGHTDTAIISLKILMLAVLIRIWLGETPTGNTVWWPAITALAAIIAMTPWLAFRPLLFSYVFLALTWLFLEKGTSRYTAGSADTLKALASNTLKAYWPVLLIMGLWVNFDSWFLLGPLTIALYGFGRIMDTDNSKKQVAASIGLLLASAVCVCIINPQHVGAYALPQELAFAWSNQATDDPIFYTLSLAPWHADYYWSPSGPILAGFAYWTLVILGIISFVVNMRQWSWARALVWFAFLLPSMFVCLLIPFFAVITIPIMSRNFIEYAENHFGPANNLQGTLRSWIMLVRPLTALGVLLIAVIAWAGYLRSNTGPPYWAIESDPYLGAAAMKIESWRKDGTLPKEARGLVVSLSAADHFAWHCPEEKTPMNSRLQASAKDVSDFLAVRKALFGLLLNSPDPIDEALAPVRRILREHKITHLIVHSGNSLLLERAFIRLYDRPEEWPLLHFAGRTAIFGWRDAADPKSEGAYTGRQIDLERKAFSNTDVKNSKSFSYPAYFDRFIEPMLPISAKRAEAALHLSRFDRGVFANVDSNRKNWVMLQELGLLGGMAVNALGPCIPDAVVSLSLRKSDITFDNYMFHQDDGPVSALLLAIRSARQAVIDNPRDARAWLVLGEAYFKFGHQTRERAWANRYPNLGRLRTIQAVSAFKQSLRLQPELAAAHFALARIFRSMGYLDMSLEHQKELLKLMQAKGPLPNESHTDFQVRVDDLRIQTEELQETVDQAQARYAEKSANLVQPVAKANMAGQMGLTGKSLEILLKTDIANFGIEGTHMELQLLLASGRVLEVNDWIRPQADRFRDNLGFQNYYWLQVQAAAAVGDYHRAEKSLKKIATKVGQGVDIQEMRRELTHTLAISMGRVMLNPAEPHPIRGEPLDLVVKQTTDGLKDLAQLADWTVMRGVLLLEAGRVVEAERQLRGALTIWNSGDLSQSSRTLDFAARPIAEGYLQLIQAGRRHQLVNNTRGQR